MARRQGYVEETAAGSQPLLKERGRQVVELFLVDCPQMYLQHMVIGCLFPLNCRSPVNHSEGTASPTGPSELLQALSPLTCVLGSSGQSVALLISFLTFS